MYYRSLFVWTAALAFGTASAFSAEDLFFDMGQSDSPVAAAYQRITIADAYDATRGNGWESAPSSDFSRAKHWPGELPYWHAQLRELPLDPLRRDGVASEKPMVFRVDVPNGRYVVRAWIGDYTESAVRQNVQINGVTIAKDVDAGLGGIWGQILFAAATPVRGVVNVSDGVLRLTFSISEKPGRNRARVLGVHIRRCEAGPVRLDQTRFVWTGPPDPEAEAVCELLNAGQVAKARQWIDALPDEGSARYRKACLLEALAGNMKLIDPNECLAVVEEASALLERPIDGVDESTRTERRQMLEEFRDAHLKMRLLGYSHVDQATKTNQFRRLDDARALAAQILPNEPLYWQGRLLQARELFWVGREGNRRAVNMAKPVIEQLLTHFPENRIVRSYANQFWGKTPVPPLKRYVVENPDAPRWAVLERALFASVADVIRFWITERQIENGEIGGGWNDDVEILRKWGTLAMAVDLPFVNAGIARMADGVWRNNPDLREHGYPRGKGDVEHAAEDVSDTQPVSIALNYGQPRFLMRCLLNSSNMDRLWTAFTPNGHRHFKSYSFGWDVVDDDPKARFDIVLNARAAKPALWAAWYAHDPELLRVLQQWSESWVVAALETHGGKPKGAFPAGVRVSDGAYFDPWFTTPSYKGYTKPGGYDKLMYEHLLGMWLITENERFLEPMHALMELMVGQSQSSGDGPEGSPAWTAKVLRRRIIDTVCRWRLITADERYDEFLMQHAPAHVRHLLGDADESAVLQALETAIDYNARNYEMLTSEVLFTDRVFLKGVPEMAAMYGGSIGISQCPTQAVRWESVGEDLVAWVQQATGERFSARLFNFADGAKRFGMQHWRLKPGEYTLTLKGTDPHSSPLWTRTVSFSSQATCASKKFSSPGFFARTVSLNHRGDSIPLLVPPRQELFLEMKLQTPFAWDPSRLPDLAPESKPSHIDSHRVDWKIYNLGSVPAKNVTVQLIAGGQTIGMQTIPEVPASRNYKLGEKMVSFRSQSNATELSITVDPEDEIAEITERNNRARNRP